MKNDDPIDPALEAVAKAICKVSGGFDRPWDDALWDRMLKEWRDPDNKMIREALYADRCLRLARAALGALAEAELPAYVMTEDEGILFAAEDQKDFRALVREIIR